MEYIIIEVPDLNDSVSRIVLNGTPYFIRFTYNDTCDNWTFGLYTVLNEPIIIGMKIVPQYPLNINYGTMELPDGFFAARTKLDKIGRYDFRDGKAQFVFCPISFAD